MRPIHIPSKYQNVTCGGCDAVILVNQDRPEGLAGDPDWCDPENHGDDCQTVARFQKSIPEAE